MTTPNQNPRVLLVDGSHGIYAWYNLASRYTLFLAIARVQDSLTLEEYDQDAAKLDFHPDNQEWCENIQYAESKGLYVQNDDGTFWRVEQIDGDIWAINPLAEWDDEAGEYVIADIAKGV